MMLIFLALFYLSLALFFSVSYPRFLYEKKVEPYHWTASFPLLLCHSPPQKLPPH